MRERLCDTDSNLRNNFVSHSITTSGLRRMKERRDLRHLLHEGGVCRFANAILDRVVLFVLLHRLVFFFYLFELVSYPLQYLRPSLKLFAYLFVHSCERKVLFCLCVRKKGR